MLDLLKLVLIVAMIGGFGFLVVERNASAEKFADDCHQQGKVVVYHSRGGGGYTIIMSRFCE